MTKRRTKQIAIKHSITERRKRETEHWIAKHGVVTMGKIIEAKRLAIYKLIARSITSGNTKQARELHDSLSADRRHLSQTCEAN